MFSNKRLLFGLLFILTVSAGIGASWSPGVARASDACPYTGHVHADLFRYYDAGFRPSASNHLLSTLNTQPFQCDGSLGYISKTQESGIEPIYNLYKFHTATVPENGGFHTYNWYVYLYTTSHDEDRYARANLSYQGNDAQPLGYAFPGDGPAPDPNVAHPIYRFYNLDSDEHFYSENSNEVSGGSWQPEGIAFYLFNS